MRPTRTRGKPRAGPRDPNVTHAMAEILTPNETATRLDATGLAFRN
jgi:hypothetical protein